MRDAKSQQTHTYKNIFMTAFFFESEFAECMPNRTHDLKGIKGI
jgi:hypothetical protein